MKSFADVVAWARSAALPGVDREGNGRVVGSFRQTRRAKFTGLAQAPRNFRTHVRVRIVTKMFAQIRTHQREAALGVRKCSPSEYDVLRERHHGRHA